MSPHRALAATGLFGPAILLSVVISVAAILIPALIAYGLAVRGFQLARWLARLLRCAWLALRRRRSR